MNLHDMEALLHRVLAPVQQELAALRRDLALLRSAPRTRPGGTLAEMERHVTQTLAACGGNHTRAALAIGIGRKTLYDKIKRYSLKAGAQE